MATRRPTFVHRDGTDLVDAQGNPTLLRGIGLGNWLLPEGYMWKLPDQASSPRQIEALVQTLAGAEFAAEFWQSFREVFITRDDIQMVAEAGFDHVRLPINSRLVLDDAGELRPDGFDHVDRLIVWCAEHGLGVLLDLHGAPGGQTGTNIDDSPKGKPELFMNDRYRRQTLDLWTVIASRYADNRTVVGYDLLNEPLPNDWQHIYRDGLVELYQDLTRHIRRVDQGHLLMYEGSHWATNWDMFTEVWDDNSALQFHRYWCPPDRTSIQDYLDVRDKLGLPIYMGEGGENNPAWIYCATRLYERHRIGWNFWTWKKLDTVTSPLSAALPPGWAAVAEYAEGRRPKPPVNESRSTLSALLEAVAAHHCTRREDVLSALFARPPLTVPGWSFETVSPPLTADRPTVLRPSEGAVVTKVCDSNDDPPDWHDTDGRRGTEPLVLHLAAGQTATFIVEPTQSTTVEAETLDDRDVNLAWSNRQLVVTSAEGATLVALHVHTTDAEPSLSANAGAHLNAASPVRPESH